jgi:hypothetical protein
MKVKVGRGLRSAFLFQIDSADIYILPEKKEEEQWMLEDTEKMVGEDDIHHRLRFHKN